VLAATGASTVDIVGHSQGGMMPRFYVKNLGGAAKVTHLVALAPSNHGTTLDGLGTLAALIPGARGVVSLACAACADQLVGSPLLTALNAGDETPGAVQYVNIATRFDEVVTPYTSAFLDGATNLTVQDGCPIDLSEHLGIPYDRRALRLVLNALDPSSAQRPLCLPVAPVAG
jgi:triacylglycerol esterase/lipase EstA (alpha/beta hydrolase family)